MTNRELIDRIIRDDDEHAYSLFFNRIYTRLIKFALYYVKNYQTAEDVVSDVFVDFLRKRVHIGTIDNVEAYFYTAVRNRSLNYMRKIKYNNVLITGASKEDYEIVSDSRPDQDLMNAELFDIISNEVNNLPIQRRVIFDMVKSDNLKYREVAKILTISQKTVEKHMSLALKIIREAVQEYLEFKDIKIKKII